MDSNDQAPAGTDGGDGSEGVDDEGVKSSDVIEAENSANEKHEHSSHASDDEEANVKTTKSTKRRKAKVCVCSKIAHEKEEELVAEDEEMADELPEQVIEITSVVVDPSAEQDLEALLAAAKKDEMEETEPVEPPEPDPEEFTLTVADPEVVIEKSEVGVDTVDLGYIDGLLEENADLKQKLASRENLVLDIKETQTDLTGDDDEPAFDVEAERARIQEMLAKFQQQQREAQLSESSSAAISQPMQIEFEIGFDFSQDPTNPNVTILRTSSTVKNKENSTAVNQMMSLELDGGTIAENEANSTSLEQEVALPMTDTSEPEQSQPPDPENDNQSKPEQESNKNDETSVEDIAEEDFEMVEMCDAATSINGYFEEDVKISDEPEYEDVNNPVESGFDSQIIGLKPPSNNNTPAEQSHYREENINFSDTSKRDHQATKNDTEPAFLVQDDRQTIFNTDLSNAQALLGTDELPLDNAAFYETYHESNDFDSFFPINISPNHNAPTLPKCLFHELDSIVRSIAQVYSHYEDFLGEQSGTHSWRRG